MTTAHKRELVDWAQTVHGLSQRHACRLFRLSRTAWRYQRRMPDDGEIELALLQLAEKHVRWGFWKMYQRLEIGQISVDYSSGQGWRDVFTGYGPAESSAILKRTQSGHIAA